MQEAQQKKPTRNHLMGFAAPPQGLEPWTYGLTVRLVLIFLSVSV